MKLRNVSYFVISLVILLLTTNIVFAQRISDVFQPISEIIRDYATDANFSLVVDLILYIWFFAQFVPSRLRNQFGDQSRRIGLPIGIILAVSLTVLEYNTGFRVSHFAPVAILILILNMMELFQGQDSAISQIFRPLRLGLIFILLHMLIFMLAQAPIIGGFIANTFLLSIANILRLLGILIILFGLGAGVGGAFSGLRGRGDGGLLGGVRPVTPTRTPAVADDNLVHALQGQISSLGQDINNFYNADVGGFQRLVNGAMNTHPTPPVPYNIRHNVNTEANRMLQRAQGIRQQFTNIQQNGQFFNLSGGDRRNYANFLAAYSGYYSQFLSDYNQALLNLW